MIPLDLSFGRKMLSNHFEKFVGVGVNFEGIVMLGGLFGFLIGMFIS